MADLGRFAILQGFKSQGGFAVDLKRPNRWCKDHGPYDFFAFSPQLDQAADGFGDGGCRSRMLTVSQLSRQAKENPVGGAGFERGKFSGGGRGRALRDTPGATLIGTA